MRKDLWTKGLLCGIIFLLLVTTFPINTIANQNGTSVNNETEYWALLIVGGVYAGDPYSNIQSTLDEVDDLYDTLCKSPGWSADHIKVIKGEDATIVNILAGLRWLDKMEDSNDISLVYVSTHGFPLGFDIPPIDEADGTDEALLTYWGIVYPSLFIWDDELNVLLNRLESKGVCLIVNSCYAGGFNDTFSWKNNYQNTIYSTKARTPQPPSTWMEGFSEDIRGNNRVILMSSHEKEMSMEPSTFTASIIDGLHGYADNNSDGIISAEELSSYVKGRVFWQSPAFYDDFDGELPLIVVPKGNTYQKNVDNLVSTDGKIQWSITKSNTLHDTLLVCGYITNNMTGNPVEYAIVYLEGSDNQGNNYMNATMTNDDGFYRFDARAGSLFFIITAEYYLTEQTDSYEINENDILWVNISLERYPPRNSVVHGYITDTQNGEPIKSSHLCLEWFDGQGHIWNNWTTSDVNGWYTFSSFAGEIHIEYFSDDYCYYRTHRNDVDENEIMVLNFSLIKNNIRVQITKPLKALYIQNQTKLPSSNAIVFGSIEIEAYTHKYWYDPVDAEKVEFYIDGTLTSTDTISPYTWIWESGGLIQHRHTIKVIAYDTEGNSASDEITVWKFF